MGQEVSFGHHRFDPRTGQLWAGRSEVKLTPRAAAVLAVLIERAGRPVTRDDLFQSVWRDVVVGDAALTACIQELRRALDDDARRPDVSIRAHIISLLEEIQARLRVSYLFIAHDLAAVSHLSQQTAVMYLGKLVEVADSLELCATPLHPYTEALFAASPPSHPDESREEIVLTGEVPSALNPPPGCHFHPRCPFAMPRCSEQEPALREVSPGHAVACYLYES